MRGAEPGGLPIGSQLVGRHFEDSLVLAAAHAFETAVPLPRLGELR